MYIHPQSLARTAQWLTVQGVVRVACVYWGPYFQPTGVIRKGD